MTEWKPIQTKIWEDERAHILKYMKKHNIKDKSKFLKQAIENILGISLADASKNTSPLPPQYLTVHNFYKKLKNELEEKPASQKILDEFFNRWRSKYLTRWSRKQNAKLRQANQLWPAFKEHKKRGRSKSPKRSPGRSADKGIED